MIYIQHLPICAIIRLVEIPTENHRTHKSNTIGAQTSYSYPCGLFCVVGGHCQLDMIHYLQRTNVRAIPNHIVSVLFDALIHLFFWFLHCKKVSFTMLPIMRIRL